MGNTIQNIYGLNEQERMFCEYYLDTRNATLSYEWAFSRDLGRQLKYSTCKTNASRLMTKEKVKRYIDERIREATIDRSLEESEILVELSRISLNRNLREADRLKALELLGRSKAMWTDKVENNGNLDIEINIGKQDSE